MRLFALLQRFPALTLKELIRRSPKHDRATIYRNIDLFEKLGIITKLWLGWQTKIELSGIFQHHHHHLSCVNCNKVWILLEDTTIENRIDKLAKNRNFKAMDHQLEIKGICKNCQALRF